MLEDTAEVIPCFHHIRINIQSFFKSRQRLRPACLDFSGQPPDCYGYPAISGRTAMAFLKQSMAFSGLAFGLEKNPQVVQNVGMIRKILQDLPIGVFGFHQPPGLVMKNRRIECILAASGNWWLSAFFRLFHVLEAFPLKKELQKETYPVVRAGYAFSFRLPARPDLFGDRFIPPDLS